MTSDSPLAPGSQPRRSPVYRELQRLGAVFEALGDSAVAVTAGADPAAETASARALALCDLSPLPRAGFKGWSAIAWTRGHGIEIGELNQMAYPQPDGALVARLADSEVLILGPLDGPAETVARLAAALPEEGAYAVPRMATNAWFGITGGHAAAMLAKVCGIDLRPAHFPLHALAQTSVARLNAIIVRADRGPTPAFHLLADSASAAYLWDALVDAMGEFAGRPVGLAALRSLAA